MRGLGCKNGNSRIGTVFASTLLAAGQMCGRSQAIPRGAGPGGPGNVAQLPGLDRPPDVPTLPSLPQPPDPPASLRIATLSRP